MVNIIQQKHVTTKIYKNKQIVLVYFNLFLYSVLFIQCSTWNLCMETKALKKYSSEYKECLAYYKWAQYTPIIRDCLIKHVNEGKRSVISGYCLKLIGLRAGLPDYQLPIATKNWHGFWLEMKTRDRIHTVKNTLQDEWIEKLTKLGHYATYAYGWEHAAELTMAYIKNKL